MTEELAEAWDKVQHLVNFLQQRGLLEDGTFTFPDGDTWWATDTEFHHVVDRPV
jgi:hypothetical protein